jgi:hypothetical protein
MRYLFLFASFVTLFTLPFCSALHSAPREIARSKYTAAHSLGDSYNFEPREGWQNVTLSDLDYKYQDGSDSSQVSISRRTDVVASIKGVADKVWKGLKGIGKKQDATITWYTGNDLKNPSCWANTKWAPTDKSFAAALTMEGWTTRPKCFKFLELCNGPKKCVFVRVIDTCAGCKKGSRHIDLTRAAFGALANYDKGILTAQFRPATNPSGWFEDLWGPKD